METNNDYKLFKDVSVTDPKYCKQVSVNGKQPFTNIDTYYLIEEATKAFGFFGKGWGLKNINYEYMDVGDTKLCILHATFFFPQGEFPITNSLKMVYKTKNGYIMIDEDVYKKLETNTIAKALSRIGFGSDVYKGKFDDQTYINDAFNAHEVCSPQQQQELRKLLGYYGVNAMEVNKHFIISTLAELPAGKYNEAVAFIQQLGEQRKRAS